MPRPKPVRERPRLLVDLSEKVSEDLRIDTPTTLTSLPRLQATTGPRAARLKAGTLAAASIGAGNPGAGRTTLARRVGARKPPPGLARNLSERIRKFLPSDGELVFTLVPQEGSWYLNSAWSNDFESHFWIGYERHLDHSVDEWMNSEWESISDSFYDHNVDLSYPQHGDGHCIAPSITSLEDAWSDVAMGEPYKPYRVPMGNAEGVVVDEVTMSAQDLMDFFGLTYRDTHPAIVIADEILVEDLKQIEEDGEVLLNGYLIRSVEDGEFTTVHLVPPQ